MVDSGIVSKIFRQRYWRFSGPQAVIDNIF